LTADAFTELELIQKTLAEEGLTVVLPNKIIAAHPMINIRAVTWNRLQQGLSRLGVSISDTGELSERNSRAAADRKARAGIPLSVVSGAPGTPVEQPDWGAIRKSRAASK
jgi:hypothetical protein